MIFDMSDAEAKLGYAFRNKDLLRKAFTHSSYTNENLGSESNEILEFFGDSILGFVVKENLFKRFPEKHEGELTTICQSILSTGPLASAVLRLRLNDVLLLGMGEQKNKENHSICEDLFEACVAAIYLDGGLVSVKKFVFSALAPEIDASLRSTERTEKPAAEAKEFNREITMTRKLERPKSASVQDDATPAKKNEFSAPNVAPEKGSETAAPKVTSEKKTETAAPKVTSEKKIETTAPETAEPAVRSETLRKPAKKKAKSAELSSEPVAETQKDERPAPEKDAKSRLSERMQKEGRKTSYILEKREGPDHEPSFTVRLEIDGKPISNGVGKSKKLAETLAAERALAQL